MIPRLVIKGLGTASLMAIMVGVPSVAAAAEKTFRVPFDFTLNGKVFPSGSYHVSAAEGALLVRGPEDGVWVMTQTLAPRGEASGQLIFHKDGGDYFLRQAWLGSGSGREIVPPRGERDRIKTARRDKRALSRALVVVPAL